MQTMTINVRLITAGISIMAFPSKVLHVRMRGAAMHIGYKTLPVQHLQTSAQSCAEGTLCLCGILYAKKLAVS